MKKVKNMNLPVSYSVATFDNERFLKLRVKVMHTGLNLNDSNFDLDIVESARGSLANIPLLAFIKKTDGDSNADFAGHEYEIKITEEDIKYTYLGRPIGIIPETNNYEVITEEDGKTYVYVDAYVWKDYANSALDILNRDQVKKVSMEIIVDDYEWNESFVDIKAYKYIGVALLGEDVREAMIGAKASVVEFSAQPIAEMMNELRDAMNTFSVNEIIEPELPVVETPVTEVPVVEAPVVEEPIVEAPVVEEPIVEPEMPVDAELDKPVTELPTDHEAEQPVVPSDESGPENESPDTVGPAVEPVINPPADQNREDTPGPEMAPIILPGVNPNDPQIEEPVVDAPIVDEPVVITVDENSQIVLDLQAQIEILTNENQMLKEYKLNIERAEYEKDVDTMLAQFSDLDEEDLNQLKDRNLSLDDLEIHLFAMRGKKVKAEHIPTRMNVNPSHTFSMDKKPEPEYAGIVREHIQNK